MLAGSLLAILLAVGAVLLFVLSRGDREPAPSAEPRPQPGRGPATEPGAAPAPMSAPPGQAEVARGAVQLPSMQREPRPPRYPAELLGGGRFEGTGRITAQASTPPAVPFPESWVLVLEPSEVLIGGERAVRREVKVAGGERELALEDVPLGGYELFGVAPGLESERELVLLARPAETEARVWLELAPLGSLTGRVVDLEGMPVEGAPVLIEALPAGARRRAQTDARGVYLFEELSGGEYRLWVGSPESPLAAPREIAFQPPGLHMPVIEVPLLGELSMLVLDPLQQPVAGARIAGYGSEGGHVEAVADARGGARERFLPPGRYTLIARAEGVGQAKVKVELGPGERREVEITLGE